MEPSMPERLPADFFRMDPMAFHGCVSSPAVGPTLICVNDIDIPCRSELYTQERINVNFLVVSVADPGFSKVPFSNVNNKTVMGDNPKPLAEYCKSESGVDKSRLQCYAYLIKKGKQKDKGARVDGSDPSVNEGKAVSYTIEPGMVFRCIVKKGGAIGGSDREKRDNFFPGDLQVIPAFSRVVVKVACKGWDKYKEGDIDAFNEEVQTKDVNPCQRGYGCGIVEVRMAPGSILSDLGTLTSILPGDPEDMRSRQQGFSDNNFAIRQNFQTESVPFLISDLSSTAFSSYDPEAQVYKVLEWSSHGIGDAIDIPAETLHRALNAPHGEDGNRLLDVALCAKAVTFVCFVNDYRCRTPGLSRITGFPVLDARKMLGCIVASDVPASETADPAVFPAGFAMGDPASAVALSASIGGPCASGPHGEIPCTPEMPLISAGVRAERAYPLSFVNPLGVVVWQGYFNASKPLASSQGAGANVLANAEAAVKFVRKRWCEGAPANAGEASPDTSKKPKKSAR